MHCLEKVDHVTWNVFYQSDFAIVPVEELVRQATHVEKRTDELRRHSTKVFLL